MIRRSAIVLLSLVSSALCSPKDQAISLVGEAAKLVQSVGKEKAIVELNKPESRFVDGEFYVFAYDLQGVLVAHPKNAKLVGKNLLEVPDVDGKFYRKEILEQAKTKGTGWVSYKYKNPESGKVERKTTYLRKVGELILCCGIYEE